MKKILIALTTCVALTAAQAEIFYNETFTYPDGSLTGVSGGLWAAHSGAGAKPIMDSAGKITLTQSALSGEDVNRSTGRAMGAGDIWYAGFDVAVSGGSGSGYFAHFIQGTSSFGSKAFVTPATHGGDFLFGMTGSANTPVQFWATDGTFGTTYRLVLSYNYDTKESKMWINPTDQSSTSLSEISSYQNAMAGFAFRQFSPSSSPSTQVIDNLIVATTFSEALAVPEPSTMALSLFGGLALLGARMRRARA